VHIDLDIVRTWLLVYGYFVLFPITIVEGPIITILAAFLASQGYLDVVLVYLIAVAGDIVGDLLYYTVGRYGRTGIVDRWGHLIGLTHERLEYATRSFDVRSGKMLLFGKLTHAIGWVVLMAAGAARMPLGRFVKFNLAGSIVKCLALVLVGYYAGQAYRTIDSYIGRFSLVAFMVIALGIAAHWYMHRNDDVPTAP